MVVILLTVKYNNAIMTACFKTCFEGLRTAFLNVNHHLSLIQNIECLFDVAAAA